MGNEDGARGKKDHAIFLDTNTLEYQLVTIKLDGIKIVIASSNKKRGLGDSKYNERRIECEEAWEQQGIVGARMTGAGFGGCTVNLVEEEYVEAFIKNVGAAYKEKVGYSADFYVVDVGDGPCKLL